MKTPRRSAIVVVIVAAFLIAAFIPAWTFELPHALANSTSTEASIVLNNSQNTQTPDSFQQQITINPLTFNSLEAQDLGNIEFCSSSAQPCPSGSLLYSWLESCSSSPCNNAGAATFWVNLGSNTIAAKSALTIYMQFLPTLVI